MCDVVSGLRIESDRVILRLENKSGKRESVTHVSLYGEGAEPEEISGGVALKRGKQFDVTQEVCKLFCAAQAPSGHPLDDYVFFSVWVWGPRGDICKGQMQHPLPRPELERLCKKD